MELERASRVVTDATELWTEDERAAVFEQLKHFSRYISAMNFSLDAHLSAPDRIVKDPKQFMAPLDTIERHVQALQEKTKRVRDLQVQANQALEDSMR